MMLKQVPFVRVLAVAAPLLLAGSLVAQDAPATGEQPPGVLADIFDNAGLIGYLIMFMSIVSLAPMATICCARMSSGASGWWVRSRSPRPIA